jgi:hypothetical protein
MWVFVPGSGDNFDRDDLYGGKRLWDAADGFGWNQFEGMRKSNLLKLR